MDLEKYADAINAIVFNGKQVVKPDKLVPIDIETQYVNKDIVTGQIHTDTRFRDKVRLAEVEDAVYCIFGIENQSTREYDMPLRVMEYEVREYLRQFKESGGKKDFKLKPVITIVMYWKPDEWKEPVTVKGLMHPEYLNWINNNGLSDYLQDYKMHLFTPYGVDKSELSRILKSEKYIQSPHWVEKLCSDGKLELAIERAETNINIAKENNELDNQSYTYVYKLFKP